MAHFLAGMILVGLGIWGVVAWWNLFGLVMRGLIPFFLLFVGLIAILASCRRLEEKEAQEPSAPEPPKADDPLDIVADADKAAAAARVS